ncbi:hypothetical protein PENVUL_c024G02699 [Penicillium vulpinum]|uniref:LysM domain-containing protein n=2 Tax=Penicillium vulpinum TaxID=29845 RepID=A0A1V6RUJ2_9EURO|nr:hypothetical protein PENVUL_c024G02699 [Penicillium vulpinum]
MDLFRIDFLALWLLFLRLATATVPVPTKDGFCFKYIIEGYDTCAMIAKAHDITEADIESFNKNTWAWLGCKQLYQGDFICLSAGKPPMPMALPQATCGPQVPGTVRPPKWADLAGMNPCASSKCCSFWGDCRDSDQYCQSAGYRAPPAGPVATVKPATEGPKSTTNAAGTNKPAGTGTAAKPTSKASTTKAGTTSKATTTTVPSTTTKKPSVPEPTHSQYAWTAPWEITMYSKMGCEGDYYHLEGYNRPFLDGKPGGCLNLHGNLNSKFTDTNVTCKWWTHDSFTWESCDASTLLKPQSWTLKNGVCNIFSKSDCDCYDGVRQYYESKGCHNRTQHDTPDFRALQCATEGYVMP